MPPLWVLLFRGKQWCMPGPGHSALHWLQGLDIDNCLVPQENAGNMSFRLPFLKLMMRHMECPVFAVRRVRAVCCAKISAACVALVLPGPSVKLFTRHQSYAAVIGVTASVKGARRKLASSLMPRSPSRTSATWAMNAHCVVSCTGAGC
jgi:hypothetical protein